MSGSYIATPRQQLPHGWSLGINISATKYITLDHSHQKRVDTSMEGNPTRQRVGGVTVHNIFRRNNDGDPDRDGNPLVKAMKGMGEYNIIAMYRSQVMTRAENVLASFLHNIEFDVVMPVKSSYGFAAEVALLVSTISGKPLLMPTFIRKRTVAEMLANYDGHVPAGLNRATTKAFKGQLADWHRAVPSHEVSMKRIAPKIRHLFQPLEISGSPPNILAQNVLVVDDLMSSGTSITSTADLLSTQTGCIVSNAVCFLSPL